MDRELNAPQRTKQFEDCLAERADLWFGTDYGHAVRLCVDTLVRCLRSKGTVYFFGNGGSAAQAQHLAAELTGRFMLERPGWAGLALSTDTSAITAIANDYGFEQIFARQLEGLARKGDVAMGITTSGESPNVLAGMKMARRKGATTIALTGNGGGPIVGLADIAIVGPSGPSWKVQEVQFALGHIICELVELALVAS